MSAIDRILSLIEERGITAYRLAKETGIAQSNIADWKKGKSNPSYGALVKIANYFEVPVEYLEGKSEDIKTTEEETISFNEIDFALYEGIKELDDESKEMMVDYMKYVRAKQKEKDKKEK